MAHTNETNNYGLPQFLGTDKASWLGDINPAMLAIDTGMNENKTLAQTAESTANQALETSNGASLVANNALNLANSLIPTNTITITYVSNPIISNIYLQGYINNDKSLINMWGAIKVNSIKIDKYTTFATTNLRPLANRTIYLAGIGSFVNSSGQTTPMFVSYILTTNGELQFPNIDLSVASNITVNTQLFCNTRGWF